MPEKQMWFEIYISNCDAVSSVSDWGRYRLLRQRS
jgi:hypothetical protein